MIRRMLPLLLLVYPFAVALCSGQTVDLDRYNRRLSVEAHEEIEVEAEVAVLQIGFANRGSTHQAVYKENLETSNRILQALLDAGVPKDNIETEELELEEEDQYGREEKPREFRASQKWRLRVAAGQAQRIVDVAVAAGANIIEEVEWTVADPSVLEVKASTAALARAKSLAVQMAKTLGIKLGELLEVSNSARFTIVTAAGTYQTITVEAAPRTPELRLFPKKVRKDATVNVVFSFEP